MVSQFASNGRMTVTAAINNGSQQRSSLESVLPLMMSEPPALADTFALSRFYEKVTDDNLTVTTGGTVFWQPLTWLPLTATGGINTMNRSDVSLVPFGTPTDSSGYYSFGNGSSRQQTIGLSTQIPVHLRGHQPLTVALGINSSSVSTNDATVTTDVLTPGVTVPQIYVPDSTRVGHTTSQSTTYGWYLEPRLNVSSRFFVTPGFRLDGGNATGPRAGLTAFPKIDLSWVALDRDAGDEIGGMLSLLRLRLAFGTAGVQPGPAQHLRLLQTTSVVVNGQTVPGLQLNSSSLGNSQLRPERSHELEGGIDFDFWDSRLQATVTGYRKTRYDAIIGVPLSPSLGSGSILENIGTVRNSGAEVTLNAAVIQNATIGWNVGAMISNNTNVLVNLAPGQTLPPFNTTTTGIAQIRAVPGYPLFGWWERPIVGYADANSNGIIERDEVIIGDSVAFMGPMEPRYNLVLNTSASLFSGRLSLYATGNYTNGLTQNMGNAQGAAAFYSKLRNDPNTSISTQAAIAALGQTSYGMLQTVNTFRFSSLSINYVVPRAVAQRFHSPTMSIALQGSNLGLHTNYRGKDPNVNAYSTGDFTQDTGQLPQPRTWSLSVHLGN
jgi:outer membrane receptor protein involved in Fe transport